MKHKEGTHKFHQGWEIAEELFPPLPSIPELELYPQVLEKVWPLTSKYRARLSRDIRDLSRILTTERGLLDFHYWNKPEFISAYLYYFLPWNLIRLMRLTAGLPLAEPGASGALLLDAGSGPLTMPLALWLGHPQWRKLPIKAIVLDAAKKPLHIGLDIFRCYAELLKVAPWEIRPCVGPLESLPAHTGAKEPWLITAANVLNELKNPLPQHGAEAANRLDGLLRAWSPLWERGDPQLLFVEPGTRLGGKTIMALRAAALEYGLIPLSPCTHTEACPLEEKGSTWCHFVFSAQAAPEWLKSLSRSTGLFKTSLSISLLLLGKREAQPFSACGLAVRVISRSFPANGRICRYGCSHKGLGMLPDAKNVFSGSLCLAAVPGREKDQKSGAVMLRPLTASKEAKENRRQIESGTRKRPAQ